MIRERAALSEDELLRAYANAEPTDPYEPRTEACACGDSIDVVNQHPFVVAGAIRAHQQSARHRAWWAREEGQRG